MNQHLASVDEILFEALKIDSTTSRAAYLDKACGSNSELRGRVEHLLDSYREAGGFMESPAAVLGVTAEVPTMTEKPGAKIGPYKIREQIGEGGFGVVFVAEQTEPVRRKVAIKVIKPGMDTKDVIARFEAERQALALMDHPNVARVLDAGATESGRPYFAMELVQGVPITEFCDEQKLSTKERLRLFVDVCQAVQHAHQKGIIHRDIKPSNVMVTMHDHKPVPKVIDFGVAKAIGSQLTAKTIYTAYGQMVGTPMYMSPEQAQMSGLDVDTRSDVYSLGVLLYELLTGTTPFDKETLHQAGFDEMRRIIREDDPPRPSERVSTLNANARTTVSERRRINAGRLGQSLRGELDWVVMKALEKDRGRRYETASKFAEDVQHYLNDEPVVACPPSRVYRFHKFVRRNTAQLVTAGALGLALLVAVGAVGWAIRDRAAQQAAVERETTDRQARITSQVELLMAEVDKLAQTQQWHEALSAAKRAEFVLASNEAETAFKEKVQATLRELEFVARLDEIRMETSVSNKDGFSNAEAVQRYGQAFRDFGVDVESLPASTAVVQLKQHPRILLPVVTALDDFVFTRHLTEAIGDGNTVLSSLVEITRGVDPVPARDQLRAAWGRQATPELRMELRKLAESFDVRVQGPQTAYLLAAALGRAGLPTLREQVLRKAQRDFPGDYWLNLALGSVLTGDDHAEAEAVRFLSMAMGVKPDSAAAHNNLGAALEHQGRLDEAINCYRKAIQLDPNYAVAHNNLGSAQHDKGELDEAIDSCRKAIQLDPNYAMAHYNLGVILMDKGRRDEAIDCYRKAIELDAKVALAHNNLGRALKHQGRLDEAIDSYHKAIQLDPNYATAHNNLGVALEQQGRRDEAINCYRKAIELDLKSAMARRNLARALQFQGNLDEAIDWWRKAIQLEPEYAKAHNDLGVALMDQGRLDEAINCHRKAIELDLTSAVTRRNLALALQLQGKLDEAIDCWRKAIQLDPESARAHNQLGVALVDQGRLDEAINCYRKAIELDPESPDYHHNLGDALHHHGKLNEAIVAIRTAIHLDPKYAEAHLNLGVVLKAQGKLDEAIAEYRTTVELEPKHGNALTNLGVALSKRGDVDEAIACYRAANELDPTLALPHLIWTIARFPDRSDGEYAEALQWAEESVKKKSAGAGEWQVLGWAFYRNGQWQEAVDALQQSVKLQGNGGDPQQWFFLAMAHWQLGEQQVAKTWFEKAVAWMERRGSKNSAARAFRDEAERLIGLTKNEGKSSSDD